MRGGGDAPPPPQEQFIGVMDYLFSKTRSVTPSSPASKLRRAPRLQLFTLYINLKKQTNKQT